MTDILFQDRDVCILNPASKRGLLVFTESKSINICDEGLLSYNELRSRHPELGLEDRRMDDPTHNDLIFFRAPYNNDVTTFESSYDGKPPKMLYSNGSVTVIRIDPSNTFVYLSEARAHGKAGDLQKSRISMDEYLGRIIPFIKGFGKHPMRYVYTGDKKLSESLIIHVNSYDSAITRFFEVVVKIPHIPREWFVSCDVKRSGGNYKEKYLKYKQKYLELKKHLNNTPIMKGGGSADTYCTLCGGPIYSTEIITNIELLKKYLGKGKYYGIKPDGFWVSIATYFEDASNALVYPEEDDESDKELKRIGIKKFLTLEDAKEFIESIKIPNEHTWLNKALILTENGVINNVKDAAPDIEVDGKIYSKYKPGKGDYNLNKKWGYLFHNDCYKLYEDTYGKINMNDIDHDKMGGLISYNLLPDKEINKYQGQYFYTNLAYLEKPYLLESPLVNLENRERILKVKFPTLSNSLKIESKTNSKKMSKKERPSPSESATLFKIGTKKIGNDGNEWIIKVNKNGVKRWGHV